MSETQSKSQHPLQEAIKAILEPLSDYFKGFGRLAQPKLLGEYILSEQATVANFVKFLLGSVLLGSFIEALLPSEGSLQFVSLPLVNDVLILVMWLLLGVVLTAITYKPLRWLGGKGQFRHTLMATIFSVAVYYPIISLIEGLFTKIFKTPTPQSVMRGLGYSSLTLLAQALALIHNVKNSKAYLAILVPQISLLICLAPIWIPLVDKYLASETKTRELISKELEAEVKESMLAEWRRSSELKDATIKNRVFGNRRVSPQYLVVINGRIPHNRLSRARCDETGWVSYSSRNSDA